LRNTALNRVVFWARHSSHSDFFSHYSPTDRARELIEPSEDAESLLLSILKNWAILGLKILWGSMTPWGGSDGVIGTCKTFQTAIYLFFKNNLEENAHILRL